MTEHGESAYPIRAVDRVCDILDLAADSPNGLSLGEAATGAHIPKSTAFRYLASLEARQYIERDADSGLYKLGIAFRSTDARGKERLLSIAAPVVASLRDRLGETINLGVLDGGFIVHELVAESPQMMRLAARVGERGFIHSTALGKAICAELPEDRVIAMLKAKGMPPRTATTITTEQGFLDELEKVRRDGYGEDDAENQESGRCVGVTIQGTPLKCGISVSAPADRLPQSEVPKVARILRDAADAIREELTASPSPLT